MVGCDYPSVTETMTEYVVTCNCGFHVDAPTFTHAENLRETHRDNYGHAAIVQEAD